MKLARLWIAGCLCLLACRQPAAGPIRAAAHGRDRTYSLAPLAALTGTVRQQHRRRHSRPASAADHLRIR